MNPPVWSDDPRHGKYSTYTNWGCRCEKCTEAQRVRQLEYIHRTGRSRPWAEYVAEQKSASEARLAQQHGTETGYHKGCRCDLCRQASRVNRKRRRHRNPEQIFYDREYRGLFPSRVEKREIVWKSR